MKTLKIIAILCIILGFTCRNANAQVIRTITTKDYVDDVLPCVGEPVTGLLTGETKVSKTFIQEKLSGILVSYPSGVSYSVSLNTTEKIVWKKEQR